MAAHAFDSRLQVTDGVRRWRNFKSGLVSALCVLGAVVVVRDGATAPSVGPCAS